MVQWSEDKIKADPFFGRSRVRFRVRPWVCTLWRVPLLAVVETSRLRLGHAVAVVGFRPGRTTAGGVTAALLESWLQGAASVHAVARSRGRSGRGYGGSVRVAGWKSEAS